LFSTALRPLLPGKSALAIVVHDRGVVTHHGSSIAEAPRERRTLDTATSMATYWYFHLPNFVLAALMYTMLGRFLLGLMVDADSPNYIWRFFCRFTDPVLGVIAIVTPKVTVPAVLWLFGFVWMFWLRVLLHYVLLVLNLAPRLGGAAS
jgi:YggT family protein